MRFVPVKSEEAQANALVFRTRDLFVRQRTQAINALRDHLVEYGLVVPKDRSHVGKLLALRENDVSGLPAHARMILKVLADAIRTLDNKIDTLEVEIRKWARENATARRLMSIPGAGPITATAIAALAPSTESFKKGRDFAAWVGPTPLQRSTEGKQRLGGTSKMDDRTLRRLLTIGAAAVVRHTCQRGAPEGSWLERILQRKPRTVVIVALANKTARIVWALLARGEIYKAPAAMAP